MDPVHNEMMSGETSQAPRREMNAPHGLLHFLAAGRDPEDIAPGPPRLPIGRELAPPVRGAQVRGRAPAGVAGEVVMTATASMKVP